MLFQGRYYIYFVTLAIWFNLICRQIMSKPRYFTYLCICNNMFWLTIFNRGKRRSITYPLCLTIILQRSTTRFFILYLMCRTFVFIFYLMCRTLIFKLWAEETPRIRSFLFYSILEGLQIMAISNSTICAWALVFQKNTCQIIITSFCDRLWRACL